MSAQQQRQRQQQKDELFLQAKLESKQRMKFARAKKNELCSGDSEADEGRVEVNFPCSKEEYEELRERNRIAVKKRKQRANEEEEEEEFIAEPRDVEEKEKVQKWVQSFDQTRKMFYYFRPETRETQWEEPVSRRTSDDSESVVVVKIVRDESALNERRRMALESVTKEELEEIEREVLGSEGGGDIGRRRNDDDTNNNNNCNDNNNNVNTNDVLLPRWEYEDDSGTWQGPFTSEQLQMWRGALPMNLKVRTHGTGASTNNNEYTSLAMILGDVTLRKRCEDVGMVLPVRCTAVEAEQILMTAIAARDKIIKENLNGFSRDDDDDDDNGGNEKGVRDDNGDDCDLAANVTTTKNRWAEAALEGLPENDRLEQEKLARDTALGLINNTHENGSRVDERASERFASVGTFNRMTGRVTAEVNESLQRRLNAGPSSGAGAAYRNIGLENYIDPAKMDEAMEEINKARHQKLSRAEIEKRKLRKKEMKKKYGDNWLIEDDENYRRKRR